MGHNPAVPHHTRYVSLLRLRTLEGTSKNDYIVGMVNDIL